MSVKSPLPIAAAALLLAASSAFAALALAEEGEGERVERVKVQLVLDQEGGPERIELDELGDMAVGETRTYPSDSGRTVLVTRDEQGWELDLDGRKIRVGDHAAGEGEVFVHRMRKFELDEEGDGKSLVWISGDGGEDHDVRIVRRVGPGGAHAFAFGPHGHALLPGPEAMIERLRENAKFRSLDAATQELVLEAIRESAPTVQGIAGEGEPGHGVVVLDVEKRVEREVD